MLRNLLRIACLALVAAGLYLMFNTQPNDRMSQQTGLGLTLIFGLCFLGLFVKRAI